MGKKRRRVLVDTSNVEFDPSFFDRPGENAAKSQESLTPRDRSPLLVAESCVDAAGTPAGTPSQALSGEGSVRSGQSTPKDPPSRASETPSIPSSLEFRTPSQSPLPNDTATPRDSAQYSIDTETQVDGPVSDTVCLAEAVATSGRASPEVIVIGSSETDIVDLCNEVSDSGMYTEQVVYARRSESPADASMIELPSSPPRAAPAAAAAGALESDVGHEPFVEPEEDDSSLRKRARKEDSLRSVSVHVESLIPGEEGVFDIQWSWAQSLFDLRDRFSADAVLLHDGSKKPWFYSPKKLGDAGSKLSVQVVTQKQWDEMVRKAELGDFVIPSSAAADEDGGAAPLSDNNAKNDGFVISIASKTSVIRAMVTRETTIRQLADYFVAETHAPTASHVKVVYDGDTLEPAATIGSLDIEEDDKLDVHIS